MLYRDGYLLNNWPSSVVVKFDDGDALNKESARKAIMKTDWAYFNQESNPKDLHIYSIYEYSLIK